MASVIISLSFLLGGIIITLCWHLIVKPLLYVCAHIIGFLLGQIVRFFHVAGRKWRYCRLVIDYHAKRLWDHFFSRKIVS